MKKITFVMVLVVLFSAAFFSCKKDNNSALIGKWTLTDTVNNYIASQTLNFTDNTHYNLSTSVAGIGVYNDTGTYSTFYGVTVVFNPTSASSPCLGDQGTYTYLFNGNYLELLGAAGNDSCYYGNIPRYELMTSINWLK